MAATAHFKEQKYPEMLANTFISSRVQKRDLSCHVHTKQTCTTIQYTMKQINEGNSTNLEHH